MFFILHFCSGVPGCRSSKVRFWWLKLGEMFPLTSLEVGFNWCTWKNSTGCREPKDSKIFSDLYILKSKEQKIHNVNVPLTQWSYGSSTLGKYFFNIGLFSYFHFFSFPCVWIPFPIHTYIDSHTILSACLLSDGFVYLYIYLYTSCDVFVYNHRKIQNKMMNAEELFIHLHVNPAAHCNELQSSSEAEAPKQHRALQKQSNPTEGMEDPMTVVPVLFAWDHHPVCIPARQWHCTCPKLVHLWDQTSYWRFGYSLKFPSTEMAQPGRTTCSIGGRFLFLPSEPLLFQSVPVLSCLTCPAMRGLRLPKSWISKSPLTFQKAVIAPILCLLQSDNGEHTDCSESESTCYC